MPLRPSARRNPRKRAGSARPLGRRSLKVVLDIVEILAADIMDVDQLPGRNHRGCEPDRNAEPEDRHAGGDFLKSDLVAERDRFARDDRGAPGGAGRFVPLDIPQCDSHVVRSRQYDQVHRRRHAVLHPRLFHEGGRGELIKSAAFFAPYANIGEAPRRRLWHLNSDRNHQGWTGRAIAIAMRLLGGKLLSYTQLVPVRTLLTPSW